MIPVPAKVFKLIITELGTLLESNAAEESNEDGDSEEVQNSIRITFSSGLFIRELWNGGEYEEDGF